jgi:ferric-dicitrate binding protein FerR (iron transport regulator)
MADRITSDEGERHRLASEEATVWWMRLHFEELARADRERFIDWLRESPLHVAEMLRLAQMHRALKRFQCWAQVNTDGPDDPASHVVTSMPPKHSHRYP